MSEQGRIQGLLDQARRCCAAEALAKARAASARVGKPCAQTCGPVSPQNSANGPPVPLESDALARKLVACYGNQTPIIPGCGTESQRISKLIQDTLDKSVDPFNPETRFSEYRRPYFPPACPPIPLEFLNGNVPKLQMRNCPLPNKPDNPVLPG